MAEVTSDESALSRELAEDGGTVSGDQSGTGEHHSSDSDGARANQHAAANAADEASEEADIQENIEVYAVPSYQCHTCGKAQPPDSIPELYPPERSFSTSCEFCGAFSHVVCGYDQATREYLHKKEQLKIPDLAVERVMCTACQSNWMYDMYNLKTAAENCTSTFFTAMAEVSRSSVKVLSDTPGIAKGGILQAIKAAMQRCTSDISSFDGRRRLVAILGPQGVGKSKLMDTMSCSLWPDGLKYTTLPRGWQPVTQSITQLLRQRLGLNVPEPLVIAATLPAGSPAFNSDGKLLGLDDLLELQANSPQYLAQYYMEGKVPDANQLMPGMLPVAREDQWIVSTTVASIAALKDARHSIMLYTFSPQMLMQVVQALRAAEQKHGLLEDYELGFLQAVFNTTDLDTLPHSVADLAAAVVPAVTDFLGELGTPVTVELPGKIPLHERIFLVHYLSRVSGQLGEREPWMWLVWFVVRGSPSGLLPGKDGLVDMAGYDSRPIHRFIRHMTLRLADGAVLVLQKDFASYGPSSMTDLEDEDLLSKAAAGNLSMMIALCDHRTYNKDKYLSADWPKVQAFWERQETSCRAVLRAKFNASSTGTGGMADKVPIVTTRALAFEGLMAAWSLGKLSGCSDEQVQHLLACTGATRMYASMMRSFKANTISVLSTVQGRTGKLDNMMDILQGSQQKTLPDDRPGGLGRFDNRNHRQCNEALNALKPHMKSFMVKLPDLIRHLPQESKNLCLNQLETVYADDGQTSAESRLRKAVHNNTLAPVADLIAALDAVGSRRPCATKKARAAQHLIPLVTWPDKLKLSDLEPLLQPLRKLLVDGLRDTMDKVPAFQQYRELQRLQVLWLEYVVPLVMDSEADTPANNAAMLAEVQQSLRHYLKEVVKELLHAVQQQLAAGDDLPTLLTNQVTRALWPTVSAGQESPLLSVVVEVLYKHLVDKPLQVLASGAQRLGRTHLLIDRLKADLCVLMSPCSLNELKEHIADLHVPAVDMCQNLDKQFEEGAANLEKLIKLMHTHKDLLSKYTRPTVIMFDNCSDKTAYLEFSKVSHNGRVTDIPVKQGESEPQLAAVGVDVDLVYLADQLRGFVFGVEGEVKLPDGSTEILRLDDPEHQQQAVRDLVQLQLIHAAVDEQHGAPSSKWFSKVTGTSANYVLTTGSISSNPMYVIALLGLLLRCSLRVRIPVQLASGPAASGSPEVFSPSKKARFSRQYLHVAPPTPQNRLSQQHGGAQDQQQGQQQQQGGHTRQMMVQLKLRQQNSSWMFDVVSSTQLVKLRKVIDLGITDSEYEKCMHCKGSSGVSGLVCCEGMYCAVALHKQCMTNAQRRTFDSELPWLCSTCLLRGRNPNNPSHRKPQG